MWIVNVITTSVRTPSRQNQMRQPLKTWHTFSVKSEVITLKLQYLSSWLTQTDLWHQNKVQHSNRYLATVIQGVISSISKLLSTFQGAHDKKGVELPNNCSRRRWAVWEHGHLSKQYIQAKPTGLLRQRYEWPVTTSRRHSLFAFNTLQSITISSQRARPITVTLHILEELWEQRIPLSAHVDTRNAIKHRLAGHLRACTSARRAWFIQPLSKTIGHLMQMDYELARMIFRRLYPSR